jgi:hypothetical protein
VKPYDGVIEFLRKRLGDTDLAGVLAWNRVTALTTDRERLVAIVDRIRTLPTDILLTARRDARRLIDFAPDTQAAIDAWLAPLAGTDGFLRSASAPLLGTDAYRRYEYATGTATNNVVPWERAIGGSDMLKVYAGIEYLRGIEGLKRLVLLSPYGLSPSTKFLNPAAFHWTAEDDRRLAVHANDARVAVDIIHTAGTPGGGVPSQSAFESLSSQQIASESGGHFTSLRTASEQLARLDAATRSGYILGYVPANPNMDGKYRNVDIRVNRRDVTVVYRRGYTARPDPPPVDPRELMARIRLRDAAASTIRFDDIRVTATATRNASAADRQVEVRVTIDPAALSLTHTGDRWTGAVDLMILCADEQDRVLGSVSQQMNLSMTQPLYDRARVSGIPYAASVPVSGPAKRVKVIVYNYDTDRLGTAIIEVK